MDLSTKPVAVDQSAQSARVACGYCGGVGSVQVKDEPSGEVKSAKCSACGGNRGIQAK